jgi:glycosyltransferase involved in cell wall biosynthesis
MEGKARMSNTPLLTVTVTNFNYARFLGQNIESILGQTFTDYELVIVDNASTDDSVDVIRKYASEDSRIRLIAHTVNIGAAASFRESCDVALGRYRVQVDADDWIMAPDALERQVRLMTDNPHLAFVYSSMAMIDEDGGAFVYRPYLHDTVLPGEVAVEEVLTFSLGHSGMMFRLDLYRACGGYPEGFKYYDDLLLAVLLCELGDVGYIDDALYAARQHELTEHAVPSRTVVRDELLPIVNRAFRGPLPSRMQNPRAIRRRVTKKNLLHLPTVYIFKGQRAVGWRLLLESVKCKPIATLLQPQILSLVARSLMSDEQYRRARQSLKGPVRGARTAV